MPRIPLFNNGQSIQTQAPGPLQSSPGGNSGMAPNLAAAGRPTVEGIEAMRRAVQQPKKPYELADNSGQEAIGNALQDSGRVFMQIAAYEAQAEAVKAEAEAELALAAAEEQFWTERENDKDFAGWANKWQQTAAAVTAPIMEKAPRKAKDSLNHKTQLWSIRGAANVRAKASRELFSQTKEAVLANIDNAILSGDPDALKQQAAAGVAAKVFIDTEGKNIVMRGMAQIKAKKQDEEMNRAGALLDDPATRDVEGAVKVIRDSQWFSPDEKTAQEAKIRGRYLSLKEADDLSALIARNPSGALAAMEKTPEKFPRTSPGDLEAAKLDARRFMADMIERNFRTLLENVSIGLDEGGQPLRADEKFDGEKYNYLTPFARAQLQARNADRMSKANQNNPEGFQKLVTEIAKYDPAKDPSGIHRVEVGLTIEANFSGAAQAELKGQLEARLKKDKPDEVPTADAFALLDRWAFEDQKLGTYKKQKAGQDGKPLFKKSVRYTESGSGMFGLGKPEGEELLVPDFEIDIKTRDRVSGDVARIKETLRGEIKAGTIKDQDTLFKRMSDLARQPLADTGAGQILNGGGGDVGGPNPLLPPVQWGPQTDPAAAAARAKEIINTYR